LKEIFTFAENQKKQIRKNYHMQTLDAIDRKLLNLLQLNSRITIRELSEKLNLSTTPVYERIKKLEKNGFIKDYITRIDPKMVGLKLIVYISVSLHEHTKEAIDAFEAEMGKLDEVMEAYYISGNSDFLLKVIVEDMEAYHRFITYKLSVIKNISQFFSSFVMAAAKTKQHFFL
jgi:DNA-binding Lrp family transcriptional regulator